MGYTTDFEGSFKVQRRRLKFSIVFHVNSNDTTTNDATKKQSLTLDNIPPDLFEIIALFAFYNGSSATLHYLRLISKNFYILSNNIHQNKLFTKVDIKTVKLINGLAKSRRMIRCRYINGIDYGIDGQYFIDTDNFGQNANKYKSLYAGKPIDFNATPRTQPSLWLQWIFDEKNQCIQWDGNEKFYYYIEWLIYLINNILNDKYIIFGKIEWFGQDSSDKGIIIIENDQKNIVKTIPEDKHMEDISKLKQKDCLVKEYKYTKGGKEKAKMLFDAINDKNWIETHKIIKNVTELRKELGIPNDDFLSQNGWKW